MLVLSSHKPHNGFFRLMNEHIWVSSWLGINDTFLTLGIFCQSSSPHRWQQREVFDRETVRVEEDAFRSSDPFVNTAWCLPLLVLAQDFPSLSRIQ